jgi:pyruvate dehydrogenase E1 component alpha subunit
MHAFDTEEFMATASKGKTGKGKTKSAARRRPAKSGAAADQMVKYYRDMLLIRRFEERAGQMYGMGLIGGFCHLYIGQEAVVVGMQAAIDERGMEPAGVMAELTGRSGGYSKGKGGSMHMFSKEKNFYGGHGIVGAQVPIGTGLAFAAKYKKTGGVSLTYLGDGAVNQGQVHEAFNMAKLWDLPVIYVIENNRYGMGTSVARASAAKELYRLGEPYGMPGEQVDGMDVLAVHAAAEKAVKHCRDGNGPYVLEMLTYRYRGHSMSDPAKYRTKEEVSDMRDNHDPIANLSKMIVESGYKSEDELKEFDKEVRAIVVQAAEFAQESPEPDPSELYTDVLVEA